MLERIPPICFCSFQHVLELPARSAKACSQASPQLLPLAPPQLPSPPLSLNPALALAPRPPRLPLPGAPSEPRSPPLHPSRQLRSILDLPSPFPSLASPAPSPVFFLPERAPFFLPYSPDGAGDPSSIPTTFPPAPVSDVWRQGRLRRPLFLSSSSWSHRPSCRGHVSFKFNMS